MKIKFFIKSEICDFKQIDVRDSETLGSSEASWIIYLDC